MKKFLMAAIVGLIICAGIKAEAADIYVGRSETTGYECYVMTETIDRSVEMRLVTICAALKMIDRYGDVHYLDYKFSILDRDVRTLEYENSAGYRGYVTPRDTPIEWAMYTVIKDYR